MRNRLLNNIKELFLNITATKDPEPGGTVDPEESDRDNTNDDLSGEETKDNEEDNNNEIAVSGSSEN